MITTTTLLKKKFWNTFILTLVFSMTIKALSVNSATIFTVTATATATTICKGDSVNLSAPTFGAIGTLSFYWTSDVGGFTSTSQNPTVSPTVTTTYTVTVTDNMGTPSNLGDDLVTTDNVVVTVNSVPNAGTDAFTAICLIESNLLTQTDLFNMLNGADAGGTWTLDGLPVTFPVSGLDTGYYIFAYTIEGNGSCPSDTANISISVEHPMIPTFNAVAPICKGETLAPLPTTSINGVTGTWSPALNNMATTTYTFIPNPGQCANAVTLTITVNNCTGSANAGTDGIVTICAGDTVTLAQLFSALGGSPDAGGVWSPAPSGAGVYTYTVVSGNLTDSATVTVIGVKCSLESKVIASPPANGKFTVGDVIEYVISVKNTGESIVTNVLFDIDFSDFNYNPLSLLYSPTFVYADKGSIEGTLKNGETAIYKTQYIISSQDLLSKGLIISAQVNGEALNGFMLLDKSDDGDDTDGNTIDDATMVDLLTCEFYPYPGISASIQVCNENTVSPAELMAALGNPDIGGTWSPSITGSGIYTYTIGNGPCTSTAQVNVSFNESVNCIPDVDVIIKIEAPNVIAPGQTVKIIVYYSATTPRDIKLFLELMAGAKNASAKSSAGYILENTKTVQTGRGSYEVTFTIPNLADSIDAYRWGAYMTTVGGGTSGMIGSMNLQEGVDVDKALSVTENELNTNFSIYPNPAQTALNVNVTEVGTLSIIDLNGKVLMKTDIKTIGNTTLNIEALNSGVYFCRYTNTKGVKTMKLVKM